MTTALAKGGNLVLSAEAPGIERVRVGLGWNAGTGPDAPELDGFASVVEEGSSAGRLLLAHQVPNPEEPLSARPVPAGPVVGDAAKLVVTLDAVPATTTRLLFGAAIYDAARRRQSFRAVTGAYIRVLDDADGLEIARYTLGDHSGPETAMVFGELYRNPRGWKFRAVGQGYSDGLRGVAGGVADPPSARPREVTGYLRRRSAARTRRTLGQHLEPSGPAPTPPAPTPPAPTPPAPSPPAPTQPPPRRAAPARPDPPARPAPPSRPAAPAPSGGLNLGSLDLGALDLGEPGGGPPARTGAAREPEAGTRSRARTGPAPTREPARGSGAATVVVGEHSSRHRQRTEHVDVLDADHPATTWTEADRGTGGMTLTLTWEVLQTSSGLPRPSDLHLAVLWQSDERTSGLMQSMDGSTSAPGPLAPRQVLRLGRRDEREGQTVYVDLTALHTFRRFVLLVHGRHGSPEWAALRPVLTAAASTGEELAIRLGEAPPSARVCLLASFHVDEDDLVIRREAEFVDGGLAEIAPRFGWDLEWAPDGMTQRGTR